MPKKKFRQPTIEVEQELSSKEIDTLDTEMVSYLEGLKAHAEEIKTNLSSIMIDESLRKSLEIDLADTEKQIGELDTFATDIETGEYDSITTKPIK